MLERALTVAGFFLEHSLTAFGLMGADPAVDDARAVLPWLHQHAHADVSVRDIQYAHRARFPRAADVTPALQVLIDHCCLRRSRRPHAAARTHRTRPAAKPPVRHPPRHPR